MSRWIDADRIDERKLWTLLVILLAIFLLYPLAAGLDMLRFYRLAILLALGQAAYSVSGTPVVRNIALALAIPAMVTQIATSSLPNRPGLILVGMLLLLAFFGFVGLIILRSVFRPGEITADRIAGSICLYLIAGMLWAILYGGILLFEPTAFNMPESTREIARQGGEMTLFYFSFVTMTTLGFGDITPASPLAQTLTWLQAVTGQLYIAILLARLVSLHVATRVRSGIDQETGPGD